LSTEILKIPEASNLSGFKWFSGAGEKNSRYGFLNFRWTFHPGGRYNRLLGNRRIDVKHKKKKERNQSLTACCRSIHQLSSWFWRFGQPRCLQGSEHWQNGRLLWYGIIICFPVESLAGLPWDIQSFLCLLCEAKHRNFSMMFLSA